MAKKIKTKAEHVSENYKFSINSFEYADLNKCAWFIYHNRIYFTDNFNAPKYCKEKWWSFLFRKLGLRESIKFSFPKQFKMK